MRSDFHARNILSCLLSSYLVHRLIHFGPVLGLGQFWVGPVLGWSSFGLGQFWVGPVLGSGQFWGWASFGWASFGLGQFWVGPVFTGQLWVGQLCLGQFWGVIYNLPLHNCNIIFGIIGKHCQPFEISK